MQKIILALSFLGLFGISVQAQSDEVDEQQDASRSDLELGSEVFWHRGGGGGRHGGGHHGHGHHNGHHGHGDRHGNSRGRNDWDGGPSSRFGHTYSRGRDLRGTTVFIDREDAYPNPTAVPVPVPVPVAQPVPQSNPVVPN